MSALRRFYRGTWSTDAFGVLKISIFFGVVKYFMEFVFGKFTIADMTAVFVTYNIAKYSSVKFYSFLGDSAEQLFLRENSNIIQRMFVHGMTLSLHIIPIYTISALVWGIRFTQTVPVILWYFVSNLFTGLPTRHSVLSERTKRAHRRSQTL